MCGGSTSFPTDVSLYSPAYLCMTESGLVVIYLCGFELLFSAMKYRLRRNGDYIRFAMNKLSEVEIHSTLTEAACDITQQDTFGCYRHCGYV